MGPLHFQRTVMLLSAAAVVLGVASVAAIAVEDPVPASPAGIALAFDDRAGLGAPDAVTAGHQTDPNPSSATGEAAAIPGGSPASPPEVAGDPVWPEPAGSPASTPGADRSTPTGATASTGAPGGTTVSSLPPTALEPTSTSTAKPPTSPTTTVRSTTPAPTTAAPTTTRTPTTAAPTTAAPTTAAPTTAAPTTGTSTPTTAAPAQAALRVVMLEGESTSDPNDGWNSYPPGVAARLPDGVTLRVDGTNGYRIDNVLAEGSKASYLSGGTDVAVLWIGINDISQGRQPTTVYAQMSQWVAARRNEGWERVIMVTVTKFEHPESVKSYSWGSHELADQKRRELNDLIVANAAGADRIVDLRGVAGIGDAFSVHDTYWRADKVHFTGAGNEAVAEQVASSVLSLTR